jgi:hypothetical protein
VTAARSAARLLLMLGLSIFGASALEAQSTYQITSAAYGSAGLAAVPAGVNGATLTLTGTLPSAAQQAATSLLGCFYTGYGSTTGFALSPPNGDNTEPLTVPASTIDSIPQTQFTAANGYSVTALVYLIASGNACDGTFDATLTNQFAVQVVAPFLGAYTGPVSIPQTNPSTGVQAAPLSLNIPAGGFLPSATTGGATTVAFGTFGSVTLAIPATATSSINVPVPAKFSSSPVGTTAALKICNTFTGAANAVCTTPSPAIALTVTALAASAGTVTATPNPVLVTGQTVLTAQFAKAANAGTAVNLGAPSGMVSFTAPGAAVAPAPLMLDRSATFTSQTTALTPPAPTPIITPAAGPYTGAQTITITDAASGAGIYYTQDGTTPTASSTLYTGPFQISSSQTVKAIAVVSGFLNSAVAANSYAITILPATQLAFKVQPVNTVATVAITPAVQVAVEDATGAVVVNSSAPVTIALGANPGETTLGGTLTVNAVNGIATFSNLTIGALGTGYTLNATSGALPSVTSSAFNITPPSITITVPLTVPLGGMVPVGLVGINATLNGTFTLSAPAPPGGVTVTLTSSTPADVTVAPATVMVPAGQTTGAFTFSGVAAGNSTLSASAPGYTTGTVQTQATSAQVSLGMIPNVAPAQMQSIALSLVTPAPAGGTTVTFTIANTNIATVTATSFIPAGQTTPAANPQVTGVLIGTTTVTANAPAYAPATIPVVVTVTAAFNPGTTYINLVTSTNSSLTISAPAPPGGIVFTLTSSNPAIATVQSSVTVVAGATSVPISITGVSAGSVTITASSAGIAAATGTVVVDSDIAVPVFTTGYDLEEPVNIYLPIAPSVPTTVTATISDPTVAIISTSDTVVGQATYTFTNVTQDFISTLWVQGLKVGTTTITVAAPGYTTGTMTVTVNPSGFVIDSNQLAFPTTTYSGPSTLTVYPAILNANLSYNRISELIPQAPTISLAVTSSSTAVGTVTSPLTFLPNNTSQNFTFQPIAVGTTNLTLGTPTPLGTPPAAFSVSTSYQQSVATVTTPVIVVKQYTTGQKLQGQMGLYLPEPPPSAVNVTITSSDPTKLLISASDTTAGSASLTISVAAGQEYIGGIWFQGQALGSLTLTVSAPGYVSGSNTINVYPSGFYYYYTGNFPTTTFSGATTLQVTTAVLYPATSSYPLALYGSGYELNPGVAPVTVPLSNSDTAVGTIAGSAVVFTAQNGYASTTFQPAAAGTTNIAITTPSGFSTASPAQTLTATVTAPQMQTFNPYTGVKLQYNFGLSLPVSTPTPETVTVTSGNAAIATLSTSATIYVNGQSAGTTTFTVSAPGFTPSTGTITVYPSGFFLYNNAPPFTTTTFSGATNITVITGTLNSNGGFQYPYYLPLSPGVGPLTIVVSDTAPSVGTISSAALVFNPGDTIQSFNFQPVSAGMTDLSISTPAGFSTPTNYQSGTVTVTAPPIYLGDVSTAVNLQQSLGISLSQTPPSNNGNGVTVIVTSSSPTLALLSKDPTVVGTSTVVFTNVMTQNVGTIYVQGQGLGTAALKETAPGYTDGNSTITIQPAGFAFYYGDPAFMTTVASGPYTYLTVYPFALNTGVNTLSGYPLMVNPGLGNISVPVTSSDTSVGTIPTAPSFAPGTSSANFQFNPAGTGTSTITIGTPTGFSPPSQYVTGTATVQ